MPSLLAEVKDVLRPLIVSAKILFANSRNCVTFHHGHDIEANGIPQWLADTEKTILAGEELLSRLDAEGEAQAASGSSGSGRATTPKWRGRIREKLAAAGPFKTGSDLHLMEMAANDFDRLAAEVARLKAVYEDSYEQGTKWRMRAEKAEAALSPAPTPAEETGS